MRKVLVIAPNWVGDAVLATPTLRAIRLGMPDAAISVLARPGVAEVLGGSAFLDELIVYPKAPNAKQENAKQGNAEQENAKHRGLWTVAKQLRLRRFDVAVLLPNSFRSAMLAFLARIRRRVGYVRDGRALLLTDRLLPLKQSRTFVAESMLTYYARLAEAVGCPVRDQRLELATAPADVEAVDALLGAGNRGRGRPGSQSRLIVLNPGGSFGPSKYWPADRFGQLADRLLDRFGGRVVISGAPAEKPIVDAVAAAMRHPAVRLTDRPIPLSAVRELVRRADLLVTNDTGPRHFAVAFGTPVVTLFGSTDPAWTETGCPFERQVRLDLPCSPCQRKLCPLGHHDCMRKMTVAMAEEAAVELLAGQVNEK